MRSGIAAAKARGQSPRPKPAAKARGQTFGRRAGYRPSDKYASEVEKLSQRQIAEKLGISKTTVNEIVKRRRAEQAERDERRERAGAKIGREA